MKKIKGRTDLHREKASHLTVSTKKNIELHLEKEDFGNVKHKIGQKVRMVIPMMTTSVDGKGKTAHARFKQAGKLKPELPKEQLNRAVKNIMKGAK